MAGAALSHSTKCVWRADRQAAMAGAALPYTLKAYPM